MTKYLSKVVLVLALALLLPAASRAQFLKPPEIAKVTGTLSQKTLPAGSRFKVTVLVDVKQGYHINAASKDALYPTTLAITGGSGITFKAPVFPAPIKKKFSFSSTTFPIYEGKVKIVVPGEIAKNAKAGPRTIAITLKYQGCDDKTCYPPAEAKSKIATKVTLSSKKLVSGSPPSGVAPTSAAIAGGFTGELLGQLGSGGPLLAVLISFLLGLTLCLTPCIYPMIPITVGFFAGQGHGHKSKVFTLGLAYVAGIAVTYSVMGLIASSFGLMIGAALQNPLVIGLIVAVFVALALSMFGLYELRPPAAIMNRSGAKSGLAGALLMGLMVGVVASPCVGPAVAGVAILVAQMKNPVLGFWVFFSMGLGMGLPFLALAMFSGALHRLPMAGGWMVSVKKVSGLALLGMAAYFGRLLFPDSMRDTIVPVYLLGAAVYLALFESSLKAHRGSWAIRPVLGVTVGLAGVFFMMPSHTQSLTWQPYTPQALERALDSGKPVIIDMGAEWCVQCKELEHKTFSDRRVIERGGGFIALKADFTRESKLTMELAKRYGVSGLPTVVFVDRQGRENKGVRINGFVPADDFLERMDAVD